MNGPFSYALSCRFFFSFATRARTCVFVCWSLFVLVFICKKATVGVFHCIFVCILCRIHLLEIKSFRSYLIGWAVAMRQRTKMKKAAGLKIKQLKKRSKWMEKWKDVQQSLWQIHKLPWLFYMRYTSIFMRNTLSINGENRRKNGTENKLVIAYACQWKRIKMSIIIAKYNLI